MKTLIAGIAILALVGCSGKSDAPKKASDPNLTAAVQRGDLAAAEALLVQGANPDSTNSEGREPVLLVAITRSDVPMVELLLKYKATPEALGPQGFSPLGWLASSGTGTGRKILILRDLVKAGADINLKNFGNTPIQTAVNGNVYNIPVVEEMIRLGSDPTIKNGNGASAIDKAIEKNLPAETVEYMKNYQTNKGKPMPKVGNTEGQCKVVAVKDEKNSDGLIGLYFNHREACTEGGLAKGVNGIFTKYDGTECTGVWKDGIQGKDGSCKKGY